MKYLHTMVRVHDLEESLGFYRDLLGLVETGRYESEEGEFTLVYLAAPEDLERAESERAPLIELTYNWDREVYQGGRNFGHLAFAVDNVYEVCQKAMDAPSGLQRNPSRAENSSSYTQSNVPLMSVLEPSSVSRTTSPEARFSTNRSCSLT